MLFAWVVKRGTEGALAGCACRSNAQQRSGQHGEERALVMEIPLKKARAWIPLTHSEPHDYKSACVSVVCVCDWETERVTERGKRKWKVSHCTHFVFLCCLQYVINNSVQLWTLLCQSLTCPPTPVTFSVKTDPNPPDPQLATPASFRKVQIISLDRVAVHSVEGLPHRLSPHWEHLKRDAGNQKINTKWTQGRSVFH